jgi:2-polyprenyl-3-methyl-5-hydroxy-6-metoxy-1,4-benzoquinol methylase
VVVKEGLLKQLRRDIKLTMVATQYEGPNLNKYLSANLLKQYFINRFLKSIAEIAERCHPKDVLDIGCGEGFIIRCLSMKFDCKIAGCDVNKEAITFAKRLNPQAAVFAADIHSLPVSDEKQHNLVICCEVLEHLDRPLTALREIKRVSSHLCIISVPHEPFFSTMNFLSGNHFWAFGNNPNHVQKWTKDGFRRFLSQELDVLLLKSSLPWLIALCQVR